MLGFNPEKSIRQVIHRIALINSRIFIKKYIFQKDK
ncbi:hypothetical protein EHW99_0269 [Erwinia amylovora]|uniref:Uncharacterized protein n=2 Tax=Erwinia amylovora TaxID=552 RepID=A0A830ZW99_ERWAM|nr:hypothetical protein EaACW_3378 [Erwinia amylovora ACW56400]QJQ52976.1 hypothetical protein EHX00_0269 [Erwinia amylovora]CBA23501.1 hypothetical protein predicted by Glimmer/Critica [Erwinia amylovora CFBP1430]CCO80215.1 hypothetical protein BN432_3446 [Erwinia amylovora Ea356]CCO84022.1 hypothetical protein BN433_3475 [Erwinia amylovora Ea266]CCO87781.1 hypothetical protein BN434_3422 [Erwinia amylovora CFBP 2585]CCO91571.1 hypothetical protein BN435_3429 [Erwinia amylovora 01SFR-BO]CCO